MKYLLPFIALIQFTAFQQLVNGRLSITSGGFNNSKGKAVLFLFRKEDKIPESSFKTLFANINNNEAAFQFLDLPYGEYAAILLHDENNNGKIDHSLGLPFEQLSYSNNWQLGFFTGMPTFAKLKFWFSSSEANQNIYITYKKNKK